MLRRPIQAASTSTWPMPSHLAHGESWDRLLLAALVLQVRPADVARAQEIIYQYDDKNFSLTDATSFVLMERLRIGAAFTTDGNFAQYGFQMLGIAHR